MPNAWYVPGWSRPVKVVRRTNVGAGEKAESARVLAKDVPRWLRDPFLRRSVIEIYDAICFRSSIDPCRATEYEFSRFITSLAAIAACYDFAEKSPKRKIVITGHTDTTGAADYNIGLSEQRAHCSLAVLMGDREGFATIAGKKRKTEDYQLILKWANRWKGWDCDPGNVDNVPGPKTQGAVKSFQKHYNVAFSAKIPESGVVEKKTWGAFFDLYMMVAEATDQAGLEASRAKLNWVDGAKKIVGCGESWPIEASRFDNYRSQTNRRVEILFFDPSQEPLLDCHPKAVSASPRRAKCTSPRCTLTSTSRWRRLNSTNSSC